MIQKGLWRDGNVFYNFYSPFTKKYAGGAFLYLLTVTVLSFFYFINMDYFSLSSGSPFDFFPSLFFGGVLFYAIGMIWLQYPLMMYAKFRFPSFNYPLPKALKRDKQVDRENESEEKKGSFGVLLLKNTMVFFILLIIYALIKVYIEESLIISELMDVGVVIAIFLIAGGISLVVSGTIYLFKSKDKENLSKKQKR